MEKIHAFRASDGSLWDYETHAERHELFLQKGMVIEEFLDSANNQYKAMTPRTIARSTIVNWEFWKNKNAK